MKNPSLARARLRLDRSWFLKDTNFLYVCGAALELLGFCLLLSIPFELTWTSPSVVGTSLHQSSGVLAAVLFFASVAVGTLACHRGFLPKTGGLKPVVSVRDRFVLALMALGCLAAAASVVFGGVSLPIGWRSGLVMLLVLSGVVMQVRGERLVR